MLYVVVDTNVIVSALLAKNKPTNPNIILSSIFNKNISLITHCDILKEYIDVLFRPKFAFDINKVNNTLSKIIDLGIPCEALHTNIFMPDEKDRVFYEVTLAARKKFQNVYLVTGNKKHFPTANTTNIANIANTTNIDDFILLPVEIVNILHLTAS